MEKDLLVGKDDDGIEES